MNDLKNLTLEDITFLLELEKTGILLKAGSPLNMSPSTASRNFSRISQCFKNPLYKFEAGKWHPTDYFNLIKPHLSAMIRAYEDISGVNFDPETSERTYTLSSVMTEIEIVLQGIIPKLMRLSPRARLDLSKHENELAAVMDGLVDFSIVTGVALPPDLHVMRLYPISRVVLLRKDHPLTRLNEPITVRLLSVYDRVSIRTGRSASWTSPDQNLFPYERYMEHTRYSTSRFHSAWGAMEKTDLIAVCGFRAAEIAMRAYDLTVLPLPVDFEEQDLWNVLVWSDQKHKDPAIIWMRSLFSEWAKEEEQRIKKLNEEGKGPPVYKKSQTGDNNRP